MGSQVVIIGAGAGGITAGLYLARAGLRVTIFEQRDRVGGLLTATGSGQYLLDVRLPCICSQGVVFPVLKEVGLDPEQLFIRADWQVMTPGMVLPLNSFDTMYSKLQAYFPHEILALRDYIQTMQEAIQWLKTLFLPHPYLQPAATQLGCALQACARPRLTLKMCNMLRTPVQQYLRRCFTDGELVHLLAHLGYPGMPALLHAGMLYLFLEDYWQPRAGLYGFMSLLAKHVQLAGGTIVTGTAVKSVMVENGRARGVILETGDTIPAAAVISCIDYNLTYRSLIPKVQLPNGFLQSLARRRPSEAYLTVCLAINLPMGEIRRLGAINTFYFPERELPKGMVITVPGLRDETCAHAPLIYLSYQCTVADNPAEIKAHLINAACKLLPGLDQHIRFAEVWHPGRYEQEFGCFSGASAGWSLEPAHILRRGFPGWKSPIQNLYHASQWIYSPGGVPAAMLSARQASRHIIKYR